MRTNSRLLRAGILIVAAAFATGGLSNVQPATAATGCSASYSVTSSWQGGFQGALSVTNLGDPRTSWSVTFTFPDPGQKLTQGWNGTWSQSGSTVTATNASWNGSLGTNAAVSLGFVGSFTGANPAPTGFALSGVTCTGSVGGTTTTTGGAVTTTTTTTHDHGTMTTSTTTTSAAITTGNAEWGRTLPPAGVATSHAYDLVATANDKGYNPKSGECAVEVHARYWTIGPDGKVYPTWHPARDPSGCWFGHEHGDDPRNSPLFATAGWPAFGYTSEVMMATRPDASMQRHEDHVGHKVLVANAVNVISGDNGTSFFAPSGTVTATCDVLLKFHQGTHSPDAFTNNLHELIDDTRCTYKDTGQTSEARFSALIPIGRPGGFSATDCPGPNLGGSFTQVGPATPSDSPSDTRSLGRLLTAANCVDAIKQGKTHFEVITNTNIPFDTNDLHEFWFSDFSVTGSQLQFNVAPLFYVLNPSRYYDPSQPNKLARQVDLCFQNIPGQYCDQVRSASQQAGGARIAFDDTRSPFKGTLREYRPGNFGVQNTGPTTVYTDVFGKNVSSTPFTGSIKQYFSGNHAGSYVRGATRDYAGSGVHSPN